MKQRKTWNLVMAFVFASAMLFAVGIATAKPVHAIEKYPLTITVKDQIYVYNGQIQGEGDTAYNDQTVIAEKVTVEGLRNGDEVASFTLDGQGTDIGEYPIVLSGVKIKNGNTYIDDKYDITCVNGKLIITGIPLNVTISGSSDTRTYNGKEQSYQGTVTVTSDDKAFDASKFHYNGNVVVKGTEAGEYVLQLEASKCTYDDKFYALKCTIGDPIKLTITGKPEPKPVPAEVSDVPLAKMTAKGSNTLVVSWSQVKGAEGYDVFFAKCRKGNDKSQFKLVKTVSSNEKLIWTKKDLKKRTAYKAYVKAWVMKDGKKTYVMSGPESHVYTSGGTKKYTNAKSVTVKKKNVSLKTGKTYKIKAKVKKLKAGKKLMPKGHAPKLRYISSDPGVAAVSKSGKITAQSKGNCYVYVYAVNGVSAKVKVTVN